MAHINPYEMIIDPATGEEHLLNSNEGKKILNIYMNMLPETEEPHHNESAKSSSDNTSSKFKFQGRSYKKYDAQYVVYDGPFSGLPALPRNLEKKISEVRIALQNLGTDFATAVIEKKPWTTHRPYGVVEKGVALNYTFITECGKLMWRKAGVSHGTRNKIYTKHGSQFYTFWLKNPTLGKFIY